MAGSASLFARKSWPTGNPGTCGFGSGEPDYWYTNTESMQDHGSRLACRKYFYLVRRCCCSSFSGIPLRSRPCMADGSAFETEYQLKTELRKDGSLVERFCLCPLLSSVRSPESCACKVR
eukprot:scpid55989/ scgid13975/ 